MLHFVGWLLLIVVVSRGCLLGEYVASGEEIA